MEGGLHFLKVSPGVAKTDSLKGWRDPVIGTLTPPYPYILSTIYHWHKPSKTTFNKPIHDYFIGIWTYTSNFVFPNPATFLIQLNVWLPQAPDSAVCSANWKIFCLGFFNEVRVVHRCNMCNTRDRLQAFLAVWCTLRETNVPHHWKRKIIGS